VVTFPLSHQNPAGTFPPPPSILGMERPGRHFRDSYPIPNLRICGCIPSHPYTFMTIFFMEKRKYCRITLMSKRGVNFYACSSTRWQFVQICTTSALSIMIQLHLHTTENKLDEADSHISYDGKKTVVSYY
jgi:hypothetical protein